MELLELATAVLQWSSHAEGPPPQGEARALSSLLQPNPQARLCLARCASQSAARHGLSEVGAVGLGPLLMAAAIALRGDEILAEILLEGLDGYRASLADKLLYHQLLRSARPHLPPQLGAALLERAPLSALLTSPPAQNPLPARAEARLLLQSAVGRRLLVQHLAAPCKDAATLNFRADLMERWRLGGDIAANLVLDIYTYAFAHHEGALKAQLQWSQAILDHGADAPAQHLRLVLAFVRWWKPLWGFSRTRPEALRHIYHLPYTCRVGIRLYHSASRIPGVRL